MKTIKEVIAPILMSTIWISFSEFVRNEWLLKSYWTKHYERMDLIFPSEPINGAVWGIWALFFSVGIFIIRKRFSKVESIGLSWLVGFLLMWLVTGNMGVLPFGLLFYAVPLSIIEVVLAVYLVSLFSRSSD
jgi:hypothetical protein